MFTREMMKAVVEADLVLALQPNDDLVVMHRAWDTVPTIEQQFDDIARLVKALEGVLDDLRAQCRPAN